MRVPPTKDLIQQGMDTRAETVFFKIGIDPETIDPQREAIIDRALEEMGCNIKK